MAKHIKISDVVELGHTLDIGGTVKISINYEYTKKITNEFIASVKKEIDKFDHAVISYNQDVKLYSKRYFVIAQDSIYNNILVILMKLLKNKEVAPLSFEIEYDGAVVSADYSDMVYVLYPVFSDSVEIYGE